MKTTRTAENLPVTLAAEAANDEFSADIDELTDRPRASLGWDPYEVWRTRVHLPQKQRGLAPAKQIEFKSKKT